MGRKQARIPSSYWLEQPRWFRNYNTEWSGVVGDRARRLRRARELTLVDIAKKIERPDGGRYSFSYFSRLERGSSSPPLYVYLALAEFYGLHPGRLLGVDDAERDATAEEMVLIRFLRRTGTSPDAALELLAGRRSATDDAPPAALLLEEPPEFDLERAPTRPPRQEIVKNQAELRRRDFGYGS